MVAVFSVRRSGRDAALFTGANRKCHKLIHTVESFYAGGFVRFMFGRLFFL